MSDRPSARRDQGDSEIPESSGADELPDDAEHRSRGVAADGLVVAEVRAGELPSELAGLRIDPRAMDLGPEHLAAEILAAAEHARHAGIVAGTVPALPPPAAPAPTEKTASPRTGDVTEPLRLSDTGAE